MSRRRWGLRPPAGTGDKREAAKGRAVWHEAAVSHRSRWLPSLLPMASRGPGEWPLTFTLPPATEFENAATPASVSVDEAIALRTVTGLLVGLGRFELPTNGLGNRCSIHLSYSPTHLYCNMPSSG